MDHECQTYRRTTCDDEGCGTTQGPLLVGAGNDQGRGSQQISAKLAKLGLVREIEAKPGAPIWRRDDAGQGYALKLTAAGLKAIAVYEGAHEATDRRGAQPQAKNFVSPDEGGVPARVAPARGQQAGVVIELLRRADGATIADLTEATGWLPHTTRAALTGLRKRGYAVIRERIGAGDQLTGSWMPLLTWGLYRTAARRDGWPRAEAQGEASGVVGMTPRARQLRAGGEASGGGDAGRFAATRYFRSVDRCQPRGP